MFKLVLLYLGINLIISSLFRLANLSSSILKLSQELSHDKKVHNQKIYMTGHKLPMIIINQMSYHLFHIVL